MERLDKILANMGFGTRKEVKLLVKSGEVRIDGRIVLTADIKIDPYSSEISVFGRRLEYKKFIYLMLNKPQGYVSATDDKRHKTVADLIPDEYSHYSPFPVGRLDIDTEGLLIMTNDGSLSHELLSPKKHVPKTYYTEINEEITQKDIAAFENGIVLDDGYKTLPAILEAFGEGCLVTIYEGKFHQIKRMFQSLGKRVEYLKRIKMGGLSLDENLPLGQVREITQEEIDKLWT